jgi:integrase
MGSIYKPKRSANLWIQYYRNGRSFRESSGSPSRKVAAKLLKQRIGELANGNFIEPTDRRVTVDELYESLLADYRNNEMASLEGAEQRWKKRLTKKFGGLRAANVTTASLDQYVAWCREQGLANATINRDLAALKRAFNLAWRSTPRRIKDVPTFPHLKEAAPRVGFVEETQYRRLATNASELWLRALLATAYAFGFRKGELLNLRVRQISLIDRTIRLNAGETKSGEGRVVVMTNDVFVLLQACCVGKDADGFVFTRPNGEQVRDFRETWENLATAAKIPGLLFHDLRRSAVRNMIRKGVSETVAMRISGHKTRSVFDRYNVVSERDLSEAARLIESENKHTLSTLGQLEQWPTTSKLPA